MDALVAFNRGDLAAALAAAKTLVQREPSNATARFVLAELLCFAGDFERADSHLDTAATLNPPSAVAIAQFRGLIRSEVARQDFYSAGRAPELLCPGNDELKARLKAAVALRSGARRDAQAQLAAAEAAHAPLSGTLDGRSFSALRDCDDLIGPTLEVLSGDGRFFWAPLSQIRSLRFQAPQRPRDLLFREVEIITTDGGESTTFVPVLYAGSCGHALPEMQLGRATDWVGGDEDIVRGVGQRMMLIDDDTVGIMEIKEVSFSTGA